MRQETIRFAKLFIGAFAFTLMLCFVMLGFLLVSHGAKSPIIPAGALAGLSLDLQAARGEITLLGMELDLDLTALGSFAELLQRHWPLIPSPIRMIAGIGLVVAEHGGLPA